MNNYKQLRFYAKNDLIVQVQPDKTLPSVLCWNLIFNDFQTVPNWTPIFRFRIPFVRSSVFHSYLEYTPKSLIHTSSTYRTVLLDNRITECHENQQQAIFGLTTCFGLCKARFSTSLTPLLHHAPLHNAAHMPTCSPYKTFLRLE